MAGLPVRSILAACACGLLISCGSDSVAGKTTTTGNGGVVALGPDGKRLAGCIAFAARDWDSVSGTPGVVDTLLGDSSGIILLPNESYAFLEISNDARTLGAWIGRVAIADGNRQIVPLDTLRRIEGRWADRSEVGGGRMFLDSTFHSATLESDGAFSLESVPMGTYSLRLAADSNAIRPMGSVQATPGAVRYSGSGNVILVGDTTKSPLWIDDFESGTTLPSLSRSYPRTSPWYMWWVETDMSLPSSLVYDSILKAIQYDSTRASRAFHTRFATRNASSWVAAGLTSMELDLSARSELCFSYRADNTLKIQFQRDSVSGTRPTLSASVPASTSWLDTCVATSSFVPDLDTPDSLRTWSTFGKRVLVIEFQTPTGGTYVDLDDIRLR